MGAWDWLTLVLNSVEDTAMNSHRRLRVWQLVKRLVIIVYKLSRALPVEEKYVAVSQIRRAAWSVSNNIAEGNARLGFKERRRFFDHALGSLAEVDSMVDGLCELYDLESALICEVLDLRVGITHGLFTMIRRGRAPT